jgi:nucleotide-binding universal stress UspA family protein
MTEADSRRLRVLWAVDGSSASESAIPLLKQAVLPITQTLTVLTVAPHSMISGARPDPAFLKGVTPAARRHALVEAEQTAQTVATHLDPQGVAVQAVSRWGNPIEEILQASRSTKADLVVLGAKGHSNLGLILVGSVAQGVVQHATRPVLITRPGATRIDRIVIGYDGSPPARRAIDFVGRLAFPSSVEFVLVWVVEPFAVPAGTPIAYRKMAIEEAHRINERHHRTAEKSIAAAAANLLARGRRVSTHVLSGPAAPELEALAGRTESDLVVVGSRKPAPARHYLLGSTAEKLVRHSKTSVLVVR